MPDTRASHTGAMPCALELPQPPRRSTARHLARHSVAFGAEKARLQRRCFCAGSGKEQVEVREAGTELLALSAAPPAAFGGRQGNDAALPGSPFHLHFQKPVN